ncbi:MAG: AbrB/MazE/SpoVT family DNA-binding domain-containing protein [Candidatus Buchananbacteria bacterium]|nr:AbrB/MazE/SpoVT family DNA-binding domain-containing protein [Candidatus Buchananbacteria bacterium]
MPDKKKHFYGTTTVGEKGQAVIPAQARQKMKIKKGEKLLVFGFGQEMITLVKLEKIEKIASQLADKLELVRKAINSNKK